MFTPELKSGAVTEVLEDWLLPPGELWVGFPAGRQASAKARAFTTFMERQLSEEARGGRTSAPTSLEFIG